MSPLEPLAPDQRAVVALVLQQGRSYDEIARAARHPRRRGARPRAGRPRGARARRTACPARSPARSRTTCWASSRPATPRPPAACSPSRRPPATWADRRRGPPRRRRARRRSRRSRRAGARTPRPRRRPAPGSRAARGAAPRRRRARGPCASRAGAAAAPRRRRRRGSAACSSSPPCSPSSASCSSSSCAAATTRSPRPRRHAATRDRDAHADRDRGARPGRRRDPAPRHRRRQGQGHDDRLPPGRAAAVRAPGPGRPGQLGGPARTRSGSPAPARKARRLGFTEPVGADGQLGIQGPSEKDLAAFPKLYATYANVVVSEERTEDAKRPAKVDPHRQAAQGPLVAASSFPGFMIPAGSQRSLSARSSSLPSAPCSPAAHVAVVAADRVVVGDRRARGGDRVARRPLGRLPLAGGIVRVLAREDGEVERGAVGIEVRDVAADDRRRRGQRAGERVAHRAVERARGRSRSSPSRASPRARRGRAARRAGAGPRSATRASPPPARGRAAGRPPRAAAARRARGGGRRRRPRPPSRRSARSPSP